MPDGDFMTGGEIDLSQFSNSGFNGTAALVPYSSSSDIGGVSVVRDDLTGDTTTILHSFAGGLQTFLNTLGAAGAGAIVGSNGAQVGYDRYGQPIYRAIDPRTGGWTTLPTAAWPGGGGSPSNNPERTPQNYPQQSLWGTLINALAFPAPVPTATVGTYPATDTQRVAPGILNSPVVGGITGGQLALGAGLIIIAMVVIRAVRG